jgi:uncharacterized membrane protein YfcA
VSGRERSSARPPDREADRSITSVHESERIATSTVRAADATPMRRAFLVVLGIAIGAYSTLCGIGGGVFAVPLLHYVYGMSLRAAVANSLVFVSASTTSATLMELLHEDSALRLDLVVMLVIGSTVGSLVGFALGKRIGTVVLKAFFAVILIGAAIHLFVADDAAEAFATGTSDFHATTGLLLQIVGIGFLAGVVAPLLGIGGGLVAVPALLALTPGPGFLMARACSMAMSVVTSWHSVWLYTREGEIRWKSSAWLAVGAVAGAAIGIQLIHVESVTQAARGLVAFALAFAGARFAWDLLVRKRRAVP